ncbi:MAG TPA: TetR/AcrR family transcriptional regulator [Caulobacteraceae bacterium]
MADGTIAMDGEAAPLSTARYARKKEAILAAATAILNRQGVKGMTLADVAAEVGLITTSVTYYYKKKDDLAAACFLRGVETFNAMIAHAAQADGWQERLTRFLDAYLDLARRIRLREAPQMVSFTEMRALKEPQRTEVVEAFSAMFKNFRGFFDAPEFAWMDRREQNARTHLLLEQAFWTHNWLRRYDVEDYPRLRDRMLDILAGGLSNGPHRWAPSTLPELSPLPADTQEASRETFLVAATRLINQRGYRGASVEDISAQLNVTKGSFYHHNEGKDDLVVDCFKRTFAVMRRAQLATRDLAGGQCQRLASATAALVEYQLSQDGPLLRASAMSALPADMRQDMIERYNRVSERFAGMISDGIAEGTIRPVDPMIAAHMLNSMLNAAASLQSWAPGVQREDAARLFARPLIGGAFSR